MLTMTIEDCIQELRRILGDCLRTEQDELELALEVGVKYWCRQQTGE